MRAPYSIPSAAPRRQIRISLNSDGADPIPTSENNDR
jgi:hypothetical protein